MRDNFDLLVIGGGIVGAAVFRRACELGLRALLLEQGALGGRATEASFGIFHGGLPYLFSFPETALLCAGEAAHLLRSRGARMRMRRQTFLRLLYQSEGRGILRSEALLAAYDRLAPLRSAGPHLRLSREEALAEERGLMCEGLLGALRFEEWALDAGDFARALIEEGLAFGGRALAGTRVCALVPAPGGASEARCTDQDGAPRAFQARAVVNAAGAWSAQIAGMAGGRKPSFSLLRETYLVLPGHPARSALLFQGPAGKHIGLIPHGADCRLGPLSAEHAGAPDVNRGTFQEGELLRASLRAVLPGLAMRGSPRTVAAVRALPGPRPWRVIDHSREGARNLITVVCGDIPFYRPAAEEALNAALRKLGRPAVFEAAPQRKALLERAVRAGGRPLCAALAALSRMGSFIRPKNKVFPVKPR
ncbi:MAG: FAD-dependent oxidoreductase [Elusimicrobia bacterium]|nr:FAD-dependent oxidoreductase [Elusimicrobiota bacterium]